MFLENVQRIGCDPNEMSLVQVQIARAQISLHTVQADLNPYYLPTKFMNPDVFTGKREKIYLDCVNAKTNKKLRYMQRELEFNIPPTTRSYRDWTLA